MGANGKRSCQVVSLSAVIFGLFLCAGCEPTKPRPGSGELAWFLIDQIPEYGGRVSLSAPPATITTNWSYIAYRGNLDVQIPSKITSNDFYDAWPFIRQLYGAPMSVQADTNGYRRGSFKDTFSGMTVELRESTNCVIVHIRKPKS